jgi:hypothetical protein
VKRQLTVLALLLTVAACGSQARPPREAPPQERGPGGPFDWDAPKPYGLYLEVGDLSRVASSMPFTPIRPRLGGLLHIFVSDPTKVEEDGILLFFFYDDPAHGRVVVKEQLNKISQTALEGMLVLNSEPSSEARFAMVELVDGTAALLETLRTPSTNSAAPNSVEFIAGDVDVTLYGPDGSFSAQVATSAANLVLPPT